MTLNNKMYKNKSKLSHSLSKVAVRASGVWPKNTIKNQLKQNKTASFSNKLLSTNQNRPTGESSFFENIIRRPRSGEYGFGDRRRGSYSVARSCAAIGRAVFSHRDIFSSDIIAGGSEKGFPFVA
jgi:hypothetical protein